MNHSIHSADRTTHLKIVVVALVAGIAVAAFGISARTGSDYSQTAQVVKAGKPVVVTSSDAHRWSAKQAPVCSWNENGRLRAAFLLARSAWRVDWRGSAVTIGKLRQAIENWRERRDSNPRPPP